MAFFMNYAYFFGIFGKYFYLWNVNLNKSIVI